MVWADPVGETGGYLVTLDCGHKMATREQRTAYHCRACEGPPAPRDPVGYLRDTVSRCPAGCTVHVQSDDVAALLSAHDAALARADAAKQECARLAAQVDALRAVVEGRTVPPTSDDAEAHRRAGGGWLFARPDGMRASVTAMPGVVAIVAAGAAEREDVMRWWPLDANGRPTAWPAGDGAGEVSRG